MALPCFLVALTKVEVFEVNGRASKKLSRNWPTTVE
jgi:hypothetical protein